MPQRHHEYRCSSWQAHHHHHLVSQQNVLVVVFIVLCFKGFGSAPLRENYKNKCRCLQEQNDEKTVVENYEKTFALSMRVDICFATRAAACNKTIKKRIKNYEKRWVARKSNQRPRGDHQDHRGATFLPRNKTIKKRLDQNETKTVTKTIKKRCQHLENQNYKKNALVVLFAH